MLELSEPIPDDRYLTPNELAERWRVDASTLANLRSRGDGIPFLKLPSGSIRYKMSDVLLAEIGGFRGFSWKRLIDAVESFGRINKFQQRELIEHLKRELNRR